MAREGSILALDFGGTQLSAALAAAGETRWKAHRRVPAPPASTAASDLETVFSLARQLQGDGPPPAVIGVSFGGPVEAATGRVRCSHHVPGWEDIPLKEHVQAALKAPAVVENDANAAAAGECRFGAGQGCRDLLYVTVSTGIGGGLILGGRVFRGADSLAGEIGHLIIQPGGPECTCGRRGCLEALAAGPAIAGRARQRLTGEPKAGQTLRSLAGGDTNFLTARHVGIAAAAGDALACEVLQEAAQALGFAIGSAITLINPQRVVIGGGVSKAGEPYFGWVRAAAASQAPEGMRIDIVPAALGDDAALWGAVALADIMPTAVQA